ncbi:MAG: hypothetical protein AB2L24_33690 [Mangrovibacterium sp.]
MNRKMDDKIVKQLIQEDFVGLPDPATEQRLHQAFMLRSAAYKTRQNSFGGFFGWLFSSRQLATKMAFATIVTAFFLIKPGVNTNQHLPSAPDSTRIDQSRAQDSAFLRLPDNANKDSVF